MALMEVEFPQLVMFNDYFVKTYSLVKIQRSPWTCGMSTQKPREEQTIMLRGRTPNESGGETMSSSQHFPVRRRSKERTGSNRTERCTT